MPLPTSASLFLPPPSLRGPHGPRGPHNPTAVASTASPTTATQELRLVFTGGGSGGHIYPAIAMADALRSERPDARIVFVGTSTGMERHIIPATGYDFVPVPRSRLSRPFLSPRNLFLPITLLRSIFACVDVLQSIRPHLVVGTGGYVSGPVCLAAAIAGVKFVLQEQNCYPGITNRALGPYAEKVFLAFNSCLKYFPRGKSVVVGNPMRGSIGVDVAKDEARLRFFEGAGTGKGKAQVVLLLGGSTGANALNVAFSRMCYEMLEENEGRYVIWQTGERWYDETRSSVKSHPRLMLTPFLDSMDIAYAAADLVVSRAGAMTCTEVLITGKPSILIPDPTAAEDHQTKNAYIMADLAGAKVIVEEELASDSLKFAINDILGNEDLMEKMSEKAFRASHPDASSKIVRCILSLLDSSST